MDPQQLPVEPGQQDENTYDWLFQPPVESLSAHNQIGTLEPHQVTEFGMSPSLPIMTQDTAHATSWETLQPCQQPAGVLEHNDIRDPQLGDQAQLDLTIERIEHIDQFQKISQELPLLADQEQMNGLYDEIINPYLDPATDVSSVGYTDPYDISHVHMAPCQTLQGNELLEDGSNLYDFDPDAWLTQQTPERAFDPFSLGSYAQEPSLLEPNSPYLQSNDLNDSYDTVRFQQLNLDPMIFQTSLDDVLVPVSNACEQQVPRLYFEAPTHTGSTQLPWLQHTGTLVSAGASVNAFEVASDQHLIAPFTISHQYDDINQSNHHTSSITQANFPLVSVVNQSHTPEVDIHSAVPAVPLQCQTVANKTVKNDGLDNMHIYENPDAERAYKKSLKRTRNVTDKVDHACFVCWLRKGKCTRSSSGPCLGCSNLLQKHTHLTSVQKFTCTVRTKFSEILPSLMQPAADASDLLFPSTTEGVFEMLEPIRNTLDIIDPRHIRQVWPKDYNKLTMLSYGFSIFRWRRAILCLQPSLEHRINVLENIHCDLLQVLLDHLDGRDCYRCKHHPAFLLAIMFEGVSSIESSVVNEAAKEHLKSAITERLSYVFHTLFATQSTASRLYAGFFNTYPDISVLMPLEYHDCSPEQLDRQILRTHRTSRGSKWGSSMEDFYVEDWQEPSEAPENPFPLLLEYVPARFLTAFGLDAEMLCHIGLTNGHPFHGVIRAQEDWLQQMCACEESLLYGVLHSIFPVALSIAMKGIFNVGVIEACSLSQKTHLLLAILIESMRAWEAFSECLRQELRTGKHVWLREPFPGLPMTMHTWAEKSGFTQYLRIWKTTDQRTVPQWNPVNDSDTANK